jgi:hypothetical protein
MPRGDSVEEIIRRIEGSEAAKVRRSMRPVEITHEILRGNLNELVKALQSYEDPEYRAHLWLSDEQLGSMATLDGYMTEVFRLFHNFVASVMTLVEHTRATMRKLYKGQPFLAEYEARVSKEFDASELAHLRIVPAGQPIHVYYGKILLRSLVFDSERRYQPQDRSARR